MITPPVTIAIASPAPVPTSSAVACDDPTANYVGVYGISVTDPVTLRFIRLLATAEPGVRHAAIDASRVPVDAATTTVVNSALATSTSCGSAVVAAAAQRMGDAVSESWGITDAAVGDRFGSRLVFIAHALAARDAIGASSVDPLLAPYGTNLAALTAPAPPTGEPPCQPTQARTFRTTQPTYPRIAVATSTIATITLKVELDSDGNVVRVSPFQAPSSTEPGPTSLVESSILAAGTTIYMPSTVACHGIAGAYLFRASFKRSR